MNFVTLLALLFCLCIQKRFLTGSNYIQHQQGTLALIITCPHGGYNKPSQIPERSSGCLDDNQECQFGEFCSGASLSSDCRAIVTEDSFTREICVEMSKYIVEKTGELPHMVVNNLHRSRLDANREKTLAAQGNRIAEEAFDAYERAIEQSAKKIMDSFPKSGGLLVDIHGQASRDQIELGYCIVSEQLRDNSWSVNDSSIRNLLNTKCAHDNFDCQLDYVSGAKSFGDILASFSEYLVIPSSDKRYPPEDEGYYRGGYTVQKWGRHAVFTQLDAIQIEIPAAIRFNVSQQNSIQFARSAVDAIHEFIPLSRLTNSAYKHTILTPFFFLLSLFYFLFR